MPPKWQIQGYLFKIIIGPEIESYIIKVKFLPNIVLILMFSWQYECQHGCFDQWFQILMLIILREFYLIFY
jgi:hypothetical protein